MKIYISAFVCWAIICGSALAGATRAEPADNKVLIEFIESYANKHSAKGEFETSQERQARVAAFIGHTFTIEVPASRETNIPLIKPLVYDADNSSLTVTLIGNASIALLRVFTPLSPEAEAIPPSVMLTGGYTKFYLSQSQARTTDKYRASNAFGAQANVSVIQASEIAVGISNIIDGPQAKPLQTQIQMPSGVAKDVIPRARWRLFVSTVMIPGQKDFVLSDGFYHPATIDDPNEVAVSGKTIMTALMKAELFDPATHAVYATFAPVK